MVSWFGRFGLACLLGAPLLRAAPRLVGKAIVYATISAIVFLTFEWRPWASSQQSLVAPRIIPFQGHLTRPVAGSPGVYEAVSDGLYRILFTLYTAPAGGESRVWGPEAHDAVSVRGGLVNVLLGSVTPLPSDAETPGFYARSLYVGITIDADRNAATTDLELVPRQVFLPIPYALEAGRAVQADEATNAAHSLNATNAASAALAV